MIRPEELTTPLYSLGAKLFVVVCRSTTTPRLKQFLAPLPPSCISASPTGSITLVSSPREIIATLHLKPSTWGNQRGARSHQANFWRRCRDSSLQDRGVAHYLLSLLFS